jgi:dihydroneopterin aldolase
VTDYVSIRDLGVDAVIGVHPWEREIEQTLLVSVDMARDVARAAASDDLADALDYSAVADTITAVLREGKFRLIETAAERIAGRLLADFPLSWLRLELRKPIASAPIPNATFVTPAPTQDATPAYTAVITIERTRQM